jgi:hypothetical protein
MDGTAGQLALFPDDPAAVPRRRHGRWLTEIASAASAIAATAAFTQAVRDADTAWQPTRTGDGRADAGRYENLLRPLLIAASNAITGELTTGVHGATLGTLTSVQFTDPSTTRGGNAVYDVGMELGFDQAGLIRIPVNVKRSKAAAVGDEAVNLTTAFRVALGTGADDARSLDLPRTRLGFWAKRHKVGVSDYYLLCVEGGPDDLRWHFQGLMTATARGRLAATIHPTREKLRYRSSTETLADDLDINVAIAEQWGPGYRPSVLREQLLLAARNAGATDAAVRRLAGVLLDSDDAALAAAVVAAIESLEGVPPTAVAAPLDA